jgi:hypothetical protein
MIIEHSTSEFFFSKNIFNAILLLLLLFLNYD